MLSPPSSPPTIDAAFLDGLINEEPLLGQNPIEQAAHHSHVHFASKSAMQSSKGFAVGPASSKPSNLKVLPTNDDEVELVAASGKYKYCQLKSWTSLFSRC